MNPYYEDETTTLYLGDMREIVPALPAVDLIVADPPYDSTSLAWDRWPEGRPDVVAEAAPAMWCFGSLRMFMDRRDQFRSWKYSDDIVWKKHNGSSFARDRFKRVHEQATFWYQGPWSAVYHLPPRVARTGPAKTVNNRTSTPHTGSISGGTYTDDGMRIQQSVIDARSMHGRAIHPTEKPVLALAPLIEYGCPPGGTVLDPFGGSGSTAEAARLLGRKAVIVEADERYCERIASRLAQSVLPFGGVA